MVARVSDPRKNDIAFVFYLIYNSHIMVTSTTIRLENTLRKQIEKLAKQWGLTFTDMVKIALHEFLRRGAHIHETTYPPDFIEELERTADETHRLYKEGKIKAYDDAEEAIDALHKEAQDCDV